MQKICKECGIEFESKRKNQKFCSTKCYHQYIAKTVELSTERKIEEERIELTLVPTNGKLKVIVLADVHSNWNYLRWAVDEIRKNPDWRVVINGDLWDADQYSSHPTIGGVKSLSNDVQEAIKIMEPIFPQILAFTWGNHEERCFRKSSGKGTMPSYFDLFFQAWKMVNPKAIIVEPMRGLLLKVATKDREWRCLIKHGKSAGKNWGIIEFRDVMATNEDIDIFVLSHVHIPMYIMVKRPTIDDPRLIHLVRTCAGIAFLPYQDKANLYVAPLGLTKLCFNKEIKVELH